MVFVINLKEEKELEEVANIQEKCFGNINKFSRNFLFNLWREFPEGFFLAKNQEKVVGYGVLKKEKEKALIFSLAVLPEMQNKGIGKEILKKMIELAKRQNFKKVYLHTKETNFKAIAFYQKFNFNIIKLEKNFYSTGENAYLMELEIEK
jgi:ribosomal-protein-alanine N-acetyltransferase